MAICALFQWPTHSYWLNYLTICHPVTHVLTSSSFSLLYQMWRIALPWQPATYKLSLLRLKHILTYLLTLAYKDARLFVCQQKSKHVAIAEIESWGSCWCLPWRWVEHACWSRENHVTRRSGCGWGCWMKLSQTSPHLHTRHTYQSHRQTNWLYAYSQVSAASLPLLLYVTQMYTTQVQRSEIRHKVKYQSCKQFLQQISL